MVREGPDGARVTRYQQLAEALEAEIQGMALLEQILATLSAGRADEVAQQLTALGELRPSLLRPDRLDARSLEISDRVAQKAR